MLHPEVAELPGGGYWVQVKLAGEGAKAEHDRQRQVELQVGQHLRVDFGTESGDPLLTGTVRTSWGVHIRGPGQLVLSREGVKEYVVIPYDADGRFSQRVPAGSYRVDVWFRGLDARRAVTVVADLPVRTATVRREFVAPGARVNGEVRFVLAGPSPPLQISWMPKGEGAHTMLRTDRLPDGTWSIDGVPPGAYESPPSGCARVNQLLANPIERGTRDAQSAAHRWSRCRSGLDPRPGVPGPA